MGKLLAPVVEPETVDELDALAAALWALNRLGAVACETALTAPLTVEVADVVTCAAVKPEAAITAKAIKVFFMMNS